MVTSLPIPIGLTHSIYQEVAERAARTPCFTSVEPKAAGLPTLPAAQARGHPGRLGVRGEWMGFGRHIQQPLPAPWEAAGAVKRAPTLESGHLGV